MKAFALVASYGSMLKPVVKGADIPSSRVTVVSAAGREEKRSCPDKTNLAGVRQGKNATGWYDDYPTGFRESLNRGTVDATLDTPRKDMLNVGGFLTSSISLGDGKYMGRYAAAWHGKRATENALQTREESREP